MSVPRRNGNANGSGGGTPTPNGGGISHVSPFIKRDRYKRNFMRARENVRNSPNPSVKKEDPDQIDANEKRLLGVEIGSGAVKKEAGDEEYNEFPLRAISKENMENMRTHLLKFQSKKKIDPTKSFHLPIRLHRKDTRNLQFQLTRAEIVQRQKEIAQYKVKQEEEKTTLLDPTNPTPNNKPNNAFNSPPVQDTSTSANNFNNNNNAINPTPSLSPTPLVPTNLPILPGAVNLATPNGEALVQNTPDSNPENKVISEAAAIPVVTQLEEAGISEHPEKVGLVTYDGKEEPELGFEPGTTDPLADVAPDGGGRARRINSKRKTRQLKVLDENAKKLRFEEFYPWVMEDFDGYNTWVGSYEAGNSDSYVLLAVENDGSFTMIPADKVYKFTARNKYATLTIDEAEKRMDKKSGEVPRWLMKHLDNIGTTTTRYDRTKRRLKAVSDQHGLGDDDEEHGDNSEVELDYDEEFADDEEAPIIDGNEQENKESEQRIKKEMLQANAMGLRDGDDVPENEDDGLFNDKKIDVEGERIKKALQKTELAALYSSDDDEINPYLSESDLENKENKSEVKKEDSDDNTSSPKKSITVKKERSDSADNLHPKLTIKSIKDCIIVLKGDKKVLQNFQAGEWNPISAKKRVREADETVSQSTDDPLLNPRIKDEPVSKKVKLEETSDIVPLITEQDIIDAIGAGKVNVKEFGKAIRKKYPGPENKKLMFAIVKKLCRKVDGEHMELKN